MDGSANGILGMRTRPIDALAKGQRRLGKTNIRTYEGRLANQTRVVVVIDSCDSSKKNKKRLESGWALTLLRFIVWPQGGATNLGSYRMRLQLGQECRRPALVLSSAANS